MFVIFLGIIPASALLMFLFFYSRNNLKLTSKKSPAPYVENSCPPCVQHVVAACKGVGTVFSKNKRAPTVPTVSQKISNRQVEITTAGLISTTNTEAINRSNTIGKRPDSSARTSLRNIKGLRLNTNIFKGQSSADAQTKGETKISVKELAKQFAQPKV